MNSTTLIPPAVEMRKETINDLIPALSLYQTLQCLPDPRQGQGKRYSLALLLSLLLLAKLAGQTGATEWIRHSAGKIADQFGVPRKQMPCQMTYCRILARIDPQVFG